MFGERPVVTYRRPRNLKDELVKTKHKGESKENRGMKRREKRRLHKFFI